MYQFVNAVCLSRSIGSQWHDVNLADILVFDIYTTYSKVFLILTNPDIPDPVYVDFDTLRAEFSSYDGTLSQLLIDLDNRTLATVTQLPSTEVKVAKYSDAFRSHYKIDLTKIGVVTPDNYPQSELNDIVITRPNYSTDLSLLHTHCLISVNGYYHYTDTDGSKGYVYDAAKTLRKSNNNHVGILSFLDIGALTKVKLLRDNIYPQQYLLSNQFIQDTITSTDRIMSEDGSGYLLAESNGYILAEHHSVLRDRIYFDIQEDLTNKSYFLVLGGYLVFPEKDVFWQSGQRTFALNINQIPYPQRIYESSLYLDLTTLGLTSLDIAPDAINTEELYSDEILKNYLTLSQSYLVIVDKPNLITNKIYLRHSHLPGMFTAYQDPVLPLIVNYGKAVEYWKTFEDGFWSVTVEDSFLRNYILSQQPIYQMQTLNGHLLPHMPFWHSQGHLLEILGYQ